MRLLYVGNQEPVAAVVRIEVEELGVSATPFAALEIRTEALAAGFDLIRCMGDNCDAEVEALVAERERLRGCAHRRPRAKVVRRAPTFRTLDASPRARQTCCSMRTSGRRGAAYPTPAVS